MKVILVIWSIFFLLLLFVAVIAAITYIVCAALYALKLGGDYPDIIQELILDCCAPYFVLLIMSLFLWGVFALLTKATM